MRIIVAFLFALISFGASAETLIPYDVPEIKVAVATPKPKPKLVFSRTKKIFTKVVANPNDLDDNDDGGPDEIDVYVGYRRPELTTPKPIDNDSDLSDYIQTRLLIARARALKKFAETHPDLV